MDWQKVCSGELWYILSGLNIQLEQSENDNPAAGFLHAKFLGRSMRNDGLVVKVNLIESSNMDLNPAGC